MREGTTSRVTATVRPYGEFYDFYSISLEKFGYHLVSSIQTSEFIDYPVRSVRLAKRCCIENSDIFEPYIYCRSTCLIQYQFRT